MSESSLENWMCTLPDDVREIPLIYLAIPGTHNSMTYGITRHSKPALDAEDTVKRIHKIAPCIVRRWAITQSESVTNQLKCGIRYFDLRISMSKNGEDYYFAHGLYAGKIYLPLQEIRDFLKIHPKELVILDFQHFYGFHPVTHKKLAAIIQEIFSNLTYGPKDGPLYDLSLNKAFDYGKSVIVIYRNSQAQQANFWPSKLWPTPWPNTIKSNELRSFLDRTLDRRKPGQGFVSQLILTPTGDFILKRPFWNVRNLAKIILKDFKEWIQEKHPGCFDIGEQPGVNVLLGDFVTLNGNEFCKIVIDLNNCLCSTSSQASESEAP